MLFSPIQVPVTIKRYGFHLSCKSSSFSRICVAYSFLVKFIPLSPERSRPPVVSIESIQTLSWSLRKLNLHNQLTYELQSFCWWYFLASKLDFGHLRCIQSRQALVRSYFRWSQTEGGRGPSRRTLQAALVHSLLRVLSTSIATEFLALLPVGLRRSCSWIEAVPGLHRNWQ